MPLSGLIGKANKNPPDALCFGGPLRALLILLKFGRSVLRSKVPEPSKPRAIASPSRARRAAVAEPAQQGLAVFSDNELCKAPGIGRP